MTSEEMQDTGTENSAITISDPEFARMMENREGPSMGDIPMWLSLGRTKDGRTEEEFEGEDEGDEFEDFALRISTKHATIAQLDEHLAYEGNKVRKAYLRILGLMTIRDGMLERASGDTSAKFWELMNGHLADHGHEPL